MENVYCVANNSQFNISFLICAINVQAHSFTIKFAFFFSIVARTNAENIYIDKSIKEAIKIFSPLFLPFT